MAATGFTPISTYYTTTSGATPSAGNLVNGELALNIHTSDGKLFYKDSAGTVQVLASKATGTVAGSTTQVIYNNAGAYAGSANMTFDGSTFTTLNSAYTGTLTGGTGVINIGSGQIYKDSSGNVGIGTSSPITKLDVVGSINFGPSDGSCVAVGATNTFTPSGGSPTAYYGMTFGGFVTNSLSLSGYNGIAFYTNAGAERMRIDSSGNLLVGTTSKTGADTVTIQGKTTGSSQYCLFAQADTSIGTAYALRTYSTNAATVVGSISFTGSATSYNTSSDYRLKENIAPMTGALDVVAQLKPVTYKWKADGSDGQGFIAHELQAVVPDCVTGEKDAVDAEGKPVYQGIDTSFLIATLTKAIQEQQVMINELKAKVAALEAA